MGIKRKVILSGELAKHFGKSHEFVISTPAEAIRALSANFRDFAHFMATSEERGVGYKVTVDKAPLGDVENLHNPFSQTVRIVPVIMGAKRGGLGGILLGAVLIGASFFLPGTALFTIGSFAPSLASMAFGLGTSLLLGGISSLLSPQPKAPKPAEEVNNQPSYTFNGAVNTTAQGQAIPVGYGRLIVGSAVISAGITASEFA